jgi:hypothetical protein
MSRKRKKGDPDFCCESMLDLGAMGRLAAFGSVMDIMPTWRFHLHADAWQADARSLASDWRAVGEDLWAGARSLQHK